jgi:DNA replication licensing factor MCM7
MAGMKILPMNQVSELKRFNASLDYPTDTERISKFILFYEDGVEHKYINQLKENREEIEIDMEDIVVHDETGLVDRIERNAMSYLNLFYRVIDDMLYNDENIVMNENEEDIFFYHRITRLREKYPDRRATDAFPSFLLRNYSLLLRARRNSRVCAVREVKADDIGSLLRVAGVVTKVSQIKPLAKVATYVCESCGAETYQQVEGDVFNLLEECGSEKCRARNMKGTLILVTRGSKFMKHQSVQIQELTSDVPHGCIPRVLKVECYASTTERCRPGDVVVVDGIFMPRPYHGIKRLKAGLLADTYLHATHMEPSKIEPVADIRPRAYPIEQLVRSIAPEIYGMEDVKKILLLMLVGAPAKVREDGMRVRGDINVLLLGDPGIAKSQLLKTCVKISRRGVYTTGKGCSGVGLTASVSKDPITGEMVLEGGALVLSDRGVCCIDELDKMSETDRVSIHEVMEQQSVSVSKAGINTTLNARCSVLGAANPVKGRYDTRSSVEHNVGLPCALLSRFDVIAVLRDEADLERDERLAAHITSIHLDEPLGCIPYSEIRLHIDEAKRLDPVLPAGLSRRLSDAYVKARRENSYITPRYLLSLIRLSIAHSRLRLRNEVESEDVTEALRLMDAMKVPVVRRPREKVSSKRAIYNLILSLASGSEESRKRVRLSALWDAVQGQYSIEEVEDVISDFAACGIWMRNNEEIIIFN